MANKSSDKLTVKHIVGYCCGDWGGSMTLYMMAGYMSRYLQVFLQVNPAILATMLLVWNIWDAVNDPLMGTLMDIFFSKAKPAKTPSEDHAHARRKHDRRKRDGRRGGGDRAEQLRPRIAARQHAQPDGQEQLRIEVPAPQIDGGAGEADGQYDEDGRRVGDERRLARDARQEGDDDHPAAPAENTVHRPDGAPRQREQDLLFDRRHDLFLPCLQFSLSLPLKIMRFSPFFYLYCLLLAAVYIKIRWYGFKDDSKFQSLRKGVLWLKTRKRKN